MTISKSKKFEDTINKWLHKLIDLSRRNRQLYFRRTKTSTVKFIKPSYQEIYDILVNKRRKMTIIYRNIENLSKPKKDLTNYVGNELISDPLKYDKPLKNGEILTDKEDRDLYSSLRTLLSRSRSSFQEQGVNILFLAIGFLEWQDTSFTHEKNLSPLILVPVLLNKISLLKPYTIEFFDDDIIINPALSVKLENDFKITLPQFEEDVEDIDAIFETIEKEIKKRSEGFNWKIQRDVYLSFFSFSKLMMYRDMKDNKKIIESHKVLRDLVLEESKEKINLYSGEDLDNFPSDTMFNVLDADSSQQEVILNAERDISFSVQGPPGTGKSQTIANIIASFLARGKSVLFVSEKMAALEVVMKRLTECGLEDFCLELHSYKSNKKTVYGELGRCLLGLEEYVNPQTSFFKELDGDKRALNEYFKNIVKTYPPFNLSSFYIHGKLLALKDISYYPKYEIQIESITRETFTTILRLFSRLKKIRFLFNSYFENPWYGFNLQHLTFDFRSNCVFEFEDIIKLVGLVTPLAKLIQKGLQTKSDLTFFQLVTFYEYEKKRNADLLLFDIEELLFRFTVKYKSYLRAFKSQYRKDVKVLKSVLSINEKVKYSDFCEILDEANSYKNRISVPHVLRWELVDPKASWQKKIQFDLEFYERFNELLTQYNSKLRDIRALFPEIDTKIFKAKVETIPFSEIVEWLSTKIDNVGKLDDWDAIESIRTEFNVLKCEQVFFTALEHQSRITDLPRAFEKSFYIQYLDRIYGQNPVLSKFNSNKFNSILENFRSLDRRNIDISKKRVLYQLCNMRPKTQWVMASSSSNNILRREIIKKRRIKPIRLLFSQIPQLIKTLKPCLLMSPLSISKYLKPEVFQFDVVLFDEASQVRPEDAIGAIMRGSQAIIVGDQKQLPPTSFFQVISDEYDEDDYEDVDFESILERFSLSGFPDLMLNHHYRSKDESLISFSNFHFYNNQLYTFPGITHKKDNIGINFEYVPNGIYDRGKSRKNIQEAKRVAELVIEHFKTNPEFSLGVIAFSQAQQDAIEVEIDYLLRSNIELEQFMDSLGLDGFFVKNLENVQGDERDIMFFSVGYGKDIDGKLGLNFGPLNRVGGERRLNVAITRARYEVKIISSIYSSEIDISKTKSEGIRLLKQYLEYAEHKGEISYIKDKNISFDEDFDSPFEIEVFNVLIKLGYTVHTQIGCSGFKIDLGIVHPMYPGRYILGLECDGSQYHSSFTARDRDRIRQEFLESLGWTIHRIWSYDWVLNSKKEIDKITNLIKNLESKETSPIIKKKEKPNPTSQSRVKEFNIEQFDKAFDTKSKRTIDFDDLPEDFKKFNQYKQKHSNVFLTRYYSRHGMDYVGSPEQIIKKIVHFESPIHIKELYKRVSECCNIDHLSPKMKSTIDWSVGRCMDTIRRDSTVWSKVQTNIPVRCPSSSGYKRKILHIPVEEIAQGICYLLRDGFSLDENETVLYAGKIFGFSSTSGKSKDHILHALNLLLKKNYIIKERNTFSLKDRNNFLLPVDLI
jgi:very-short-patch-repair endonuclease